MKKMENDYLHYLKSCISKLLEQAQSLEEDLNGAYMYNWRSRILMHEKPFS